MYLSGRSDHLELSGSARFLRFQQDTLSLQAVHIYLSGRLDHLHSHQYRCTLSGSPPADVGAALLAAAAAAQKSTEQCGLSGTQLTSRG